ncbi:MAG: hypothetical protein ABW168_19790 [Sedimenticola sp.]
MARTDSQQSIIEQFEAVGSIDSRFENIECVSPSVSGEKKGCFSIIFTADDIAEGKKAAIKLMDPDWLGDKYRLAGFDREPEILNRLIHKRRCLKLIYGPKPFDWQIQMPGGGTGVFKVNYFISEWLDVDVEPYFLDQQSYDALVKLKIFRNVVLAVDAIHSEDVSHRDIKADNFRGFKDRNELTIALIDFGTAAHLENPLVTDSIEYPKFSVGAAAFSGPEAFVGFASCREIGKLTDIYALGGLLYQLFNLELFGKARADNVDFEPVLTYLSKMLAPLSNDMDKINVWTREVQKIKYLLEPPKIDGPGSTLPKSIIYLISKIHKEMTLFDFTERTSNLKPVIIAIDSAIRVLENHRLDQIKLERKRNIRRLRKEKIKRREQKITEYLSRKQLLVEKC